MAEDGGVEPHPISQNPVFKAGRSTNTAASSSITLVLRTRIELVMDAYQASVIPFNYPRKSWCWLVESNYFQWFFKPPL